MTDSDRARRDGWLLFAAITALTALAAHHRFIQDDAFISFRYARHLAEGHGLVWNPGERVEGYTNFLWTLLMALPFRLGIDPVAFSQAVGLALFPATLWVTARTAAAVVPDARFAPLVAVVLLGTNYTFSAYATGGLETQLHALLLGGVVLVGARTLRSGRAPSVREAALGSLAAGGALLTRMDSALPLAIVYGFVALEMRRGWRADPAAWRRAALAGALPGALVVGAWLAWKLAYYGSLLPNTYYAKMIPFSESWQPGLRYLLVFLKSYWLAPLLVLAALLAWRARERWERPHTLLLALVIAGVAYVVRIGGDFMEFRALVPVLPPAFVLATWFALRVSPWRPLGVAVLVAILAGSVAHARSFGPSYAIEPISLLDAHITEDRYGWADAGRKLGELFGAADADDPVRIATGAAGAVPFYSRLRALDSRGLTEPWVARHGLRTNPLVASPGHHRVAPFAYLVERDVNLVMGHPWVTRERPGEPRPRFGRASLGRLGLPAPADGVRPPGVRLDVLEVPLDGGRRLWLVYLVPHPRIDAVIRREQLRTYTISLR